MGGKTEMHFSRENTYLAVNHHLEHSWYIDNILSSCCNFHYVSSNCLYSCHKICKLLTRWSIFIIMWRNNKFTFLWLIARNKAHEFVSDLQTNKFVTIVAILSIDIQAMKKHQAEHSQKEVLESECLMWIARIVLNINKYDIQYAEVFLRQS